MMNRVSGAPISWGVCEVPGWGYQLDPSLVLEQMRGLGLTATELGPVGFLPEQPQAKAEMLASYGLRAVAEFVPVVLHDSSIDPTSTFDTALDGLIASGAGVVVLAASTGTEGYDERPVLDGPAWKRVAEQLDSLSERAAARGIVATLHPHVGTIVETAEEIDRVLTTSAIGLCLDTGHALIGGADPVAIAREASDRIKHVHLKDVDLAWAQRVQAGEIAYSSAVAQGMYKPLGEGQVDIAAIVKAMEAIGYDGWYVLEQDAVLAGEPTDGGPAADVAKCVDYLRTLD